jgi:transglutaminase/protease-like cytokinesis protein 3
MNKNKRTPLFMVTLFLLVSSMLLTSCEGIGDAISTVVSSAIDEQIDSIFSSVTTSNTTTITSSINTSTTPPTSTTSKTTTSQITTITLPRTTNTTTSTSQITSITLPKTTSTTSTTNKPSTTPSNATALLSKTPAITPYSLPKETFADALEKEASDVIDDAICKAISYVNATRDDRHSHVVFAYEKDIEGDIAELSPNQQKLLATVVDKLSKFEKFEIKAKDYDGDLLVDMLSISRAFITNYPDINSYADISYDFMNNSLVDSYFDPKKDANYSVDDGKITMDEVKHEVALMNRVIDRIIRFMPSGLSTYDKYYYLGAVLASKNTYDGSVENRGTPYGALISGRSVCEGYQHAYTMLCKAANLYCGCRAGLPGNEGHGWNIVKLESGTFNVDITWCDSKERYKPYEKSWYTYFMMSEKDQNSHGYNPVDKIKATGNKVSNPYEEFVEK